MISEPAGVCPAESVQRRISSNCSRHRPQPPPAAVAGRCHRSRTPDTGVERWTARRDSSYREMGRKRADGTRRAETGRLRWLGERGRAEERWEAAAGSREQFATQPGDECAIKVAAVVRLRALFGIKRGSGEV